MVLIFDLKETCFTKKLYISVGALSEQIMVIEPGGVQNHTFDFNSSIISDQNNLIALHSVQLPLYYIHLEIAQFTCSNTGF